VKLDLQYIDQWSLWLDFTILLRTIPVVLFGYGAR
jgi:lipopolysaccharide/colanic/teichoic acid biosynthesis glycosyltransferase